MIRIFNEKDELVGQAVGDRWEFFDSELEDSFRSIIETGIYTIGGTLSEEVFEDGGSVIGDGYVILRPGDPGFYDLFWPDLLDGKYRTVGDRNEVAVRRENYALTTD